MSGQRPFQQINVLTGEQTVRYDYLPDDQLESILQRSHQAYLQSRETPLASRIEKAMRFADLLEQNAPEIRQSISKDNGRPPAMADFEIFGGASIVRYFAQKIEKFLEDEPIETSNEVQATLKHEPLGIVCTVAPFNATTFQFAYIVLPQLLAGNSVVNKSDENNYTTALKTKELADQAGFGDQYLACPFTHEQISRILEDDRVCGLQFTGSSQVGKYLGSIAARNLKIVSLELGSIDPMFVLADANQEKALEYITFMRYVACGEICTSPKRIYVQEEIYDEFVQKLEEEAKKFKPQDPLDPECKMGPLARKDIMEKAIWQTQQSVADGAELRVGGDSPGGLFMNPTLLVNVPHDAECFKSEVFGPVVSVTKFQDFSQIVDLANDCNFGLITTIWTSQTERVENEVIPRIQSGAVYVNNGGSINDASFGGVKDSGIGRQGGYFGVKEFLNKKAVVMNPTVA